MPFPPSSLRGNLWLSENQVQDGWQTENQEGGRRKASRGCSSGAAQAGKLMARATMKLDAVTDDFTS